MNLAAIAAAYKARFEASPLYSDVSITCLSDKWTVSCVRVSDSKMFEIVVGIKDDALCISWTKNEPEIRQIVDEVSAAIKQIHIDDAAKLSPAEIKSFMHINDELIICAHNAFMVLINDDKIRELKIEHLADKTAIFSCIYIPTNRDVRINVGVVGASFMIAGMTTNSATKALCRIIRAGVDIHMHNPSDSHSPIIEPSSAVYAIATHIIKRIKASDLFTVTKQASAEIDGQTTCFATVHRNHDDVDITIRIGLDSNGNLNFTTSVQDDDLLRIANATNPSSSQPPTWDEIASK